MWLALLAVTTAASAQDVTLKLGAPLPKRPALFGVTAANADVATTLKTLHLVTTAPDAGPRLVEARGPLAAELDAVPERLWPSALIAYGVSLARREAAAGTPFRLAYGLKPVEATTPSLRYLRQAVSLPVHSLYAAGVAIGALLQPTAQSAILDTFAQSATLEAGNLSADATAQVMAHLATFAAEADAIHTVDVSNAPRLSIDLCGHTFPSALSAVALVNPQRIVFAVLNASDQPIRTLVPLDPWWVKVRRVVYRGGPLELAGTQSVPPPQILRMPWLGPLLAQEDGYCCATGETVPLDCAPFALSLNIIER
ncbi:MAG: hypothetical protein HZB16_22100 [Armatimonadetes bacterium]|nr:hypothetical protein [Armatimonadota bacterium]